LARYPAPAGRVAEILADQSFIDAWLAGEPTFARSASVAGTPPGAFTVSIRRRIPVGDLPPQLRQLMPRGLDVRQVNAWEAVGSDGVRRGTSAVDILGAPVKLTGTMALVPKGDEECEQRYAIDLQATVPMMGAKIEQAAAHVIQRALDTEKAAMLARLNG